jgi:cysteine desulfurase/selenocysteine lyase
LSSGQSNRQAGILTVAPMRESVETVFRRLQRAGVICAVRGGGVRFSPHFYTPRQALDRALGEL